MIHLSDLLLIFIKIKWYQVQEEWDPSNNIQAFLVEDSQWLLVVINNFLSHNQPNFSNQQVLMNLWKNLMNQNIQLTTNNLISMNSLMKNQNYKKQYKKAWDNSSSIIIFLLHSNSNHLVDKMLMKVKMQLCNKF